jgi:hypothetical protein
MLYIIYRKSLVIYCFLKINIIVKYSICSKIVVTYIDKLSKRGGVMITLI